MWFMGMLGFGLILTKANACLADTPWSLNLPRLWRQSSVRWTTFTVHQVRLTLRSFLFFFSWLWMRVRIHPFQWCQGNAPKMCKELSFVAFFSLSQVYIRPATFNLDKWTEVIVATLNRVNIGCLRITICLLINHNNQVKIPWIMDHSRGAANANLRLFLV